MSDDDLHLDRSRAESFGTVALDYERYRAGYPGPLFDDLAALRPERVLDVGCGTGKVAVGLAERGLSVLGVELDPRMAEIAGGLGVPVDVAAFETWADAGRRFDLITCGTAWHWIDPERGMARAAEVLRPGGTIARFWNYHLIEEPLVSAIEAVYREYAPSVDPHGREPEENGYVDAFTDNDAFTALESRTYRVERTLTADEWVRQAATFSDHQRLDPDRLTALSDAVRATIDSRGGTVRTWCCAFAVFARRA